MLGYTEAELESKCIDELTYADDLERELLAFEEVLSGQRATCTLELRYLCKNGRVIWGYQSISLVRDRQGRPQYFICVVKDIDASIQAKQELERSRARLKAVLESLSESVLVYNQAGELLEANSAAIRLFEYLSEKDIVGRPEVLDKTFKVHTLDGVPVPVADWPISRLFRGQPVSNVELVVQRRGSERIWIGSFSGSVIQDNERAAPLAVLTLRDISKRNMLKLPCGSVKPGCAWHSKIFLMLSSFTTPVCASRQSMPRC